MEYSNNFDIEVGERNSRQRPETSQGLGHLWRAVRRQRSVVAVAAACGLVLGLVYYELAPAKYSASTVILVTTRPNIPTGQDGNPVDPTMEALDTDSQVEVITSIAVGKKVIETLSPEDIAALRAELRQSFSRKLLGFLHPSDATPSATDEATEKGLVTAMLRNLEVKRTGRTALISINYTAGSPRMAALIANTVGVAFETVLRERRLENESGKLAWLQQRVEAARVATEAADNDLRNFRAGAPSGQNDVALRELQQKAENYSKVYQSLLRRVLDTADEQTYPQSEFKVISSAEAPENPSSPVLALSAGVGLTIGALLGALVGASRELLDRTFRSGAEIEEQLSLSFIGYLPLIETGQRTFGVNPPKISAPAGKPSEVAGTDAASTNTLLTSKLNSIQRYSTDYPDSRYAETLRAIRVKAVALKSRQGSRVISLMSTVPNEGKSISSLNLARILAKEGARTLLIDVDFRKRTLSRILEPRAARGLGELLKVVSPDTPLNSYFVRDPSSGLLFLPMADEDLTRSVKANELPDRIEVLLQRLRKEFDFIVFDLPPVAAVADARPFAAFVDASFLMIEWGHTNKNAVRRMLEVEHGLRSRIVGAVLNKVDLTKLALYESVDQHHYHLYYANYFSENGRRKTS